MSLYHVMGILLTALLLRNGARRVICRTCQDKDLVMGAQRETRQSPEGRAIPSMSARCPMNMAATRGSKKQEPSGKQGIIAHVRCRRVLGAKSKKQMILNLPYQSSKNIVALPLRWDDESEAGGPTAVPICRQARKPDVVCFSSVVRV